MQLSRPAEAVWSLVLTVLAMAGLLLLASLIVLWDIQGFQDKVEKLFHVQLDTPVLTSADTRYARDTAKHMAKKLIEGGETGVFSAMPGEPAEAPTDMRLHPRQTGPLPERLPERNARMHSDQRRDYLEHERSSRNQAIRASLPVLSLRKVENLRPGAKPALGALYSGIQGGAGSLGQPGETMLSPEGLTVPDSPTVRSISPGPPEPTLFPRDASAASMSRRLVEERPARGYPSLDSDIQAAFAVYRAPGTEEAYFRLTLSLREESKVQTIAKDVLFLVDISQSIGRSELRRVREGIKSYLQQLADTDRWNIAVFSENVYYLHTDSMFVRSDLFTPEAVDRFVERRIDERRTNVFLAARQILSRIPPSNRPCNVFLISDGKANAKTSDVRPIIHDFQRVNRDNFSVFTFNAGSGGNLYLLSLLSYRSRGRLRDCPDKERTTQELLNLCHAYDQPVLTNAVANYTNIRTADVHPEVLPNLYRHAPITFWGRTTPGREVALRVAGLGQGGPREFFFRTVVPEGSPREREVVRGWARGKAHTLMAVLGSSPENKNLRQEILALAQKYELDDIVRLVEKKSLLPWK